MTKSRTEAEMPSPDYLRQVLRCDPDTGMLFWRTKPRNMFNTDRDHKWWNTMFSGKRAFTSINSRGYITGGLDYKTYLAHRVIWAIAHGEWPGEYIDHINGDRTDNRLTNLRCATPCQNQYNRVAVQSNNKSGFRGVSWNKTARKWQAAIKIGGVNKYLGSFDRPEEASAAYRKAAGPIHDKFARKP